jgi:uncharacterized membrane protein
VRARHRGDDPPEAEQLALERMLFFSDAVFAIAITLLVIELRLPDLPARATSDAVIASLQSILPAIAAYALSFATIGLYWLTHWRRYRYIERVDERLAAVNLLQLGLIAFIPFPTALIGEHGDVPIVVAIYAISLSAAGLLGMLAWRYAALHGLMRPGLTREFIRSSTLRGLPLPAVMLGSLLLMPFVGPFGVEYSWIVIMPVQIVLNRRLQASSVEA